ncbi:MAG: OmpA family protein [Bacteroidetes bacterium]|nr:OmpA family protein [Bacteroidota bacterium]
MKKISVVVALLAIILCSTNNVWAEVTPIANGYHVVVATFSEKQEKEARHFSQKLNKQGYHSGYGLEKGKQFIYVFLQSFEFGHYDEAVNAMLEARKKPEFATAWVVKIKDGREIKEDEPIVEEKKVETPEDTVANIVTEYIDNPPMTPIPSPQHLGNTPVFLGVYRDKDGKEVQADVKVYDVEKDKLITTAKSNAYLNLPDPKSKSGKLGLTATAFGYSDSKLEIGYYTTEQDTLQKNVVLFGSYFQLMFPLTKMNVGQEVVLSKVSFFNDAAIMTPASKDQLMNLLDMLTENPSMRIRLNGHTASNGRGKVIYMGPSKNFFGLTPDRKEENGSSKELSLARAQVIKDWLVEQGVAADRVEAVGWGGSKPVYDKKGTNARKNARVELEVLQ